MRLAYASPTSWPELPFDAWRDTRETLHRWTQIVGKIKLALTPLVNHWWNVALVASPRGLATGMIPYGDRWFELELDFLDDRLALRTSDGSARAVALGPRSVAELYADTMAMLRAAEIDARVWPVPVELLGESVRLDRDEQHRAYDKRYVLAFWRIVALSSEVLMAYRSRFVGKASPIHFFWGSFDLAASRYSGRRATGPRPPGPIEREAYSHEVHSVGWWPGDRRLPAAAYYAYIAPEPPGFRAASISTPGAYYHDELKLYCLPYDEVRRAADPRATLLEFCQQTYAAAAELAGWDRAALER